MTTFFRLFLLTLFMALMSGIFACTDCSSLENNDNVPQGNGPLASLYTGDGFGNVPFEIPETYVSVSFAPTIRSVKVPTDYEIILHEGHRGVGAYIVISGRDVPSLEEYYFSARMRSVRYGKKTETTLQHPQIFEEKSCAGKHHFLPFGVTDLPELTFFRSIKVPAGVTVKLTTAIGPRISKSYEFTSDTSELPFTDPVKSVSVTINLSGEI